MRVLDDPFELVPPKDVGVCGEWSGESTELMKPSEAVALGAATARFHGFDGNDQPLVKGVPHLPQELIAARSTVPLVSSQVGSSVVLVFEQGDPRRPIIVGVLQEARPVSIATERIEAVSGQTDDSQLVLSAEREIVMRCGDASITLTRAGKVLIKGAYILSRSSGCNKIKGAAVDIN
jgi:hypothetical protein